MNALTVLVYILEQFKQDNVDNDLPQLPFCSTYKGEYAMGFIRKCRTFVTASKQSPFLKDTAVSINVHQQTYAIRILHKMQQSHINSAHAQGFTFPLK